MSLKLWRGVENPTSARTYQLATVSDALGALRDAGWPTDEQVSEAAAEIADHVAADYTWQITARAALDVLFRIPPVSPEVPT